MSLTSQNFKLLGSSYFSISPVQFRFDINPHKTTKYPSRFSEAKKFKHISILWLLYVPVSIYIYGPDGFSMRITSAPVV